MISFSFECCFILWLTLLLYRRAIYGNCISCSRALATCMALRVVARACMVPGALTAHRGDVARSVFIFTSRDEIQYSKISPIKLAGTVTTPWHPIPPFLTANTAESEFSVTDRFFYTDTWPRRFQNIYACSWLYRLFFTGQSAICNVIW